MLVIATYISSRKYFGFHVLRLLEMQSSYHTTFILYSDPRARSEPK